MPEAFATADGGFVVTYVSDSVDPDDEGIAARIFGRGTAADDVPRVDAIGTMAGLAGNDVLRGTGSGNGLSGGAGQDRLIGGSGDDVLAGGGGADMLTGGQGADRFVFAQAGADAITDFGRGDLIALDAGALAGLGGRGRLALSVFGRIGSGAITADHRILYDAATGVLYVDANGSGPGGRVQLATVGAGTDLAAAGFLVI